MRSVKNCALPRLTYASFQTIPVIIAKTDENACKRCAYTGCQTCTNATLCETCKTGYWGKHCNLTCSGGCVNNTCNIEDGSCVCNDGYFGKTCQHECAKTCPLSSMRANKTLCNSITGECSYCKTGFFGQFCDSTCNSNCEDGECKQMSGKCSACPLNETYGDACEKPCSKKCNQRQCHVESGNCSLGCIPNHYGPQCEFTCSTNCKPTANWVVCDANGACLGGCVGWYSGDKCLTGEINLRKRESPQAASLFRK